MLKNTKIVSSDPIRHACLVAQSCLSLCDPMDCSPPDFSVHGILQARILEWAAIPTPGDLLYSGIEPASLASSALTGGFFTTEPPGKSHWYEC